MLDKFLGAIASYVRANPAVVSWVVTVAVAAASKWGLHLDPAQIATVTGVTLTLAHAWLHTATKQLGKNPQLPS